MTPDELRISTQLVVAPDETSLPARLGARVRAAADAVLARDAVILVSLLVVAAAVRLPGLAGRGDFQGDQGHDMLTLLRFVRDGVVPLLGPPTSIGDFHHGAAYYFLLAPVVWVFGPDPMAVLVFIAALGTAAVGITWWLARALGGRVVALIAGVLLAVSPSAIEESTFIWNPSPIPFFAVLALAAAWRAHQVGGARWWALAVASAGMVVQLHVLGIVFVPPVLAFAAVEWRAARRRGDARRARQAVLGVAAGFAIIVLLFVPLLVHELQSGFGETQRLLAYFGHPAAAERGGVVDPFERLVFTGLRVIGWPLAGLVTSAPVPSILLVSLALVLGIWRMIAARGDEGLAARWLGLSVAWGAVTLTVLAPSLQTVIAGLPNDHYHAFLDPVVIILLALGLRAAAAGSGLSGGIDRTARIVVAGLLVLIIGFDVSRWPPLTQANGGWTVAQAAGTRIAAHSLSRVLDIRTMPDFETAEGIGFPVIAAGGSAVIATDVATAHRAFSPGTVLVIACDRLFEPILPGRCGGPAEAWLLERIPGLGTGVDAPILVDRFDISPRTSVSIYRPVGAGGTGTAPTGAASQVRRGTPPGLQPILR